VLFRVRHAENFIKLGLESQLDAVPPVTRPVRSSVGVAMKVHLSASPDNAEHPSLIKMPFLQVLLAEIQLPLRRQQTQRDLDG
jgi:hypothetical protein